MANNKMFLKTQKRKKNFITEILGHKAAYLLCLPAIVYTIVYGYATYPYALIAFQRYHYQTGIFRSRWVGFTNFEFFFGSPRALQVTVNTLRINILSIIFTTVLAVLFALLFNEVRNRRFAKINQSTFLFPHFLSWVLVSYMIYAIFSTDLGIANQILRFFGFSGKSWYSDPQPWPWIIVFARVWKGLGMSVVIYLATITGMDREIYESATVDGANRFQQNMYITIPLLMPTVAILTLLALGGMFSADFAMIYSIIRDNGLLYPTADVIDTYVFRALRRTGDPSHAMAVGLYQSLMGFILVFGSNRIVKKYFREGALF